MTDKKHKDNKVEKTLNGDVSKLVTFQKLVLRRLEEIINKLNSLSA